MTIITDDNIDLYKIERFTTNYKGDVCELVIESKMGNISVTGNYTEICVLENFIFQLHKSQRDKNYDHDIINRSS